MIGYIKVAAFLNFAAALFYYVLDLNLFLFFLLLVAGVFFLDGAEKGAKYFQEKQLYFGLAGLITLMFNPFGAIFIFLALINKNKKGRIKFSCSLFKKANNKAMLLKLSVFCLLTGGIILTTVSWDLVSDLFKIIILTLLVVLFYLLAIYSQKKLNNSEITKLFWNLALTFILFILFASGVFAIFGFYFSLLGEGVYLYLTAALLLFATATYYSALKFKDSEYYYTTLISLLLATIALLTFSGLNMNYQFLLIIIALISGIYFQIKIPYIADLIKYMAILVLPALYLILVPELAASLSYIIIAVAVIGLLIYYTYQEKEDHYLMFFAPFVTTIIITTSIGVFPYLTLSFFPYALVSFIAIFYAIMLFLPIREVIRRFALLSFNVLFIYIYFDMMSPTSITNGYPLIYALIITSLILLTNIISLKFSRDNIILMLEKYLQPIKVAAFIIVSYLYLYEAGYLINYNFILPILYTVFLGILLLVHYNQAMRYIYYVSFNIVFLIALVSTYFMPNISLLLIPAAFIMLLYTSLNNDQESEKMRLISYVIFMITLFSQLTVNDMFNLGPISASFLSLLIFMLALIFVYQYTLIFKITVFMSLFTLFTFIYVLDMPIILYLIVSNLIGFFALWLVNLLVLKEKTSRVVITFFAASALLISVIFVPHYIMAIYVAVMAIILAIIAYYYREYFGLYYISVILLITNIIYHLRVVWLNFPIWAYLLLLGMLLMFLVVYNEVKPKIKTKKK